MNWRTQILDGMDPTSAPLVLIGDPDGLLRDAELAQTLAKRGYTLLPYDDPIAFRLVYEADPVRPTVVVTTDRARAVNQLPYDLVARGLLRTVGLAGLFPRLHIPALAELLPADLDRLWPIYGQRRGPLLSADDTAAAVLQICYGIALHAIQTAADALVVLLQIHTADRPLPLLLAAQVRQQLLRVDALAAWPIDDLLADRAQLEQFVSRAWPGFLIRQGHLRLPPHQQARIEELHTTYHPAPGIPFDDPRIWPLIDTLFLAGRLTPLTLAAGWEVDAPYTIGTRRERGPTPEQRAQELAHHLIAQLPAADAPGGAWLSLAPRIGELLMLTHEHTPASALLDAERQIRAAFSDWLFQRYASLLALSPLPSPRLVSHLAHWMAAERQRGVRRQALLVLDGLALDQWAVLRHVWEAQSQGWSWDERALFAWLPTLTSISRQAIFAGDPPLRFAASLDRTDREESHWRQFWAKAGLQHSAVVYAKGLNGLDPTSAANQIAQVIQQIEAPGVQVAGLVIDAVDTIAHGMRQGEAGMLRQVRQWAESGWLARLIAQLHAADMRVILTADHGNLAAHGAGRPADGMLAEERGLRARIYADTALRDRTASQYPGGHPWDGNGLPASIAALLAPDGQAFAPQGELVVAHGGADLREVIVPWCILR